MHVNVAVVSAIFFIIKIIMIPLSKDLCFLYFKQVFFNGTLCALYKIRLLKPVFSHITFLTENE